MTVRIKLSLYREVEAEYQKGVAEFAELLKKSNAEDIEDINRIENYASYIRMTHGRLTTLWNWLTDEQIERYLAKK
jgi:hypothetical protein